ncbi:sortase A [Okibacterium sp. HSC-33S16]|uniref:class E sortase n=1 Tax=Okibacterium sp. HSC-33S16 TaxID=2910965 RepID=UPI00209E4903|nr:class E sortase [Okibacterium sp. HSC-33S16]MCP2032997.1 sortase A [Okibacterium sp. HSC-33S16]
MPSTEPVVLETRADRRKRSSGASPRPKSRISVIGVIGELLITGGVLVMLFLVWQLWLNDAIVRAAQDDEAAELSKQWASTLPTTVPSPDETHPQPVDYGDPVILPQPKDAETFGVMHVPRFGPEYAAKLAGGVTKARTLDPLGIGHYPDTQMPGEIGNFAIAGHRNTHGKPLNAISSLQVGDAIVIQVPEGWYTYRYRSTEYVKPSGVGVLDPVPQADGVEATDSFITLTSCNPYFSTAERIVAYGVFESWTPTEAGPPAALTEPLEG